MNKPSHSAATCYGFWVGLSFGLMTLMTAMLHGTPRDFDTQDFVVCFIVTVVVGIFTYFVVFEASRNW